MQNSEIGTLQPLIADFRFKPYQEYEICSERIIRFVRDEILSCLSSRSGIVLICREKGRIVGFVSENRSDWDSQHFEIRMARIEYLAATGDYSKSLKVKRALLSGLVTENLSRDIHHLTCAFHTEDLSSIQAAESCGFRTMDTKVFYGIDFGRKPLVEFKATCNVREFRSNDLPKLIDIARESFKDGRIATDRFHADPSLSKEKSNELYVKWLVNSVNGFANIVLVAETEGTIVGYITCKIFDALNQRLGKKFGSMVISAVSPHARQRGIYTSLFGSGLQWLSQRVEVVEIGTQVGNYVVQGIWPKFGFALRRSENSFAKLISARWHSK